MKLTWHAWARAALFCVTGLVCALFVVNTLSVPVRGRTTDYVAQFTQTIDSIEIARSIHRLAHSIGVNHHCLTGGDLAKYDIERESVDDA